MIVFLQKKGLWPSWRWMKAVATRPKQHISSQRTERELFTTPPVLTTSLLYFATDQGLVWERTTWIIPWGFARVGRTNQGIKNQCFCACYQTSADCTQPPLPVSLPGNQRLHLNTVDLHMHMLSIVTVPGQSMTDQYLVYYTFHI